MFRNIPNTRSSILSPVTANAWLKPSPRLSLSYIITARRSPKPRLLCSVCEKQFPIMHQSYGESGGTFDCIWTNYERQREGESSSRPHLNKYKYLEYCSYVMLARVGSGLFSLRKPLSGGNMNSIAPVQCLQGEKQRLAWTFSLTGHCGLSFPKVTSQLEILEAIIKMSESRSAQLHLDLLDTQKLSDNTFYLY